MEHDFGNLAMKKLLTIAIVFASLTLFAANPSFQQVSNIVFQLSYNVSNMIAGTNISFATSNGVLIISATASGIVTNGGASLSLAQSNILSSAVTNVFGTNTPYNRSVMATLTNFPQIFLSQPRFQNIQIEVGADASSTTATGTLTPSVEHSWAFVFPAYSQGIYNNVLISADSTDTNTLAVDFGGYRGLIAGASQIFFDTGATPLVPAARRWTMDSNGNFYPYQVGSTVTFGTSSVNISAAYVSNLLATAFVRSVAITASTVNSGIEVVTNSLSAASLSASSGLITNSFIVFGTTNAIGTPPPNNPNKIYIGLSTNLQGKILISSNGFWHAK